MVQRTCDLCGRMLERIEQQYIAVIEIRPTIGICEDDDDPSDRDHLLELHEMLESEAEGSCDGEEEPSQQEFTLCHECCLQFKANPLARDSALHFDFSEN